MKVYFIRHGQTVANERREMSGSKDVPLTALGLSQAKEASEKLKDISFQAIYASDLQRAHNTAREIAAGRNQEIELVPGLRERDFGVWEGMTFDQIKVEFPEEWQRFIDTGVEHSIPESENHAEFFSRVVGAYESVVGKHSLDSDDIICIVAHAGVLMCLFSYLTYGDNSGYFKYDFGNSKINMIEYVMGYPIIKALNA